MNKDFNCNKCKEILKPNNLEKWKFSLIGTFLVLILFNNTVFKLTQKFFGNIISKISNKEGCPTTFGYLLHAIVFTILVRYSMEMNI